MSETRIEQYIPPKQQPPAMRLIELAISSNAEIEKLERLLVLQERWDANESRKAYIRAISEFKSNPLSITKDGKASFGTRGGGNAGYDFATLGNITRVVGPALSRCGLSASWETRQEAAQIAVTCRVTHIEGHSETTSLTAAADTSGAKNSIQAVGSTITYLQRYTLMSLLGLAAGNQDDDGQAAEAATATITDEQAASIEALADEVGADFAKFCSFFKISDIEQLPAAQYARAIKMLEAKRRAS